MNRRVTDSELVTNIADRGLRIVGIDHHRPLRGREFVFPAALAAACPGCLDTGSGPLPDSLAFVFCKSRDDVKVELPTCRRGVDRLGERSEPDSLLLELGNKIVQFPHVPSKPIKTRHHEGVALTQNIEGCGELWSCFRPAADVFLKDPATLRFFERIELQRQVLLMRRDSGVANDHKGGGAK